MDKDSFQKQYPNYQLIPAKGSPWLGRAGILLAIVGLVGVPGYLFYQLGSHRAPISNMAGMNQFSLSTLRHQAMAQVQAGQYQEAARNFKNYFALGGRDLQAMSVYADALQALGYQKEAVAWKERSRIQAMERPKR